MNEPLHSVLVVGATGSIGRLVVAEALRKGFAVRALVREHAESRGQLPPEVDWVVGDLTQPETLPAAVEGVDAIVFAHGSRDAGKVGAESVDYGGVLNVLAALRGRRVRIALMTAIGVTNRSGAYNQATEALDWKRRGERLVRASGLPYTIVRPGWFDYNDPDQHKLVLLQDDTHWAGDPSDGVIARAQVAERASFAAWSRTTPSARRSSYWPSADRPPKTSMRCLPRFRRTLRARSTLSTPNMPFEQEPPRVRDDLQRFAAR